MRTLRGAIIGAVSLLLTLGAAPLQASAAPPPPPYNAFIYQYEGAGPQYGFTFTDSDSTFHAESWQGPDGLYLLVGHDGSYYSMIARPPVGAKWVVGTTYQTSRGPFTSEKAFFSTGYAGSGCSQQDGTLTVQEANYNPDTNVLTSFAASYAVGCEAWTPYHAGQVNWNSTIGYTASGLDSTSLDFGEQGYGLDGTPKSVTLTSKGTLPLQVGTVSLSGANPASFTLSADTCTGATLAFGETCSVTVTPHPQHSGAQSASLTLADNSLGGRKVVTLSTQGIDPHRTTHGPTWIEFGELPLDEDGPAQQVQVTATGTLPATLGTFSLYNPYPNQPLAFAIVTDNCSGKTLSVGESCVVSVRPHPTVTGPLLAYLKLPDNSDRSVDSVGLSATGITGPVGTYRQLAPSRILDTRDGTGAPQGAIGAGKTLGLQVLGRGGVPAGGVSAVVLNVTVTRPTKGSFLTVYPGGLTRPTASSLNFPAGWTGANSVTVGVGGNGKVNIFNLAGSTHVIVDVMGFYVGSGGQEAGGQYFPLVPERMFDSREDGNKVKLGANRQFRLAIDFAADNSHIRAFAVNITAVQPGAVGFLTAWNGQNGQRPGTSTLNFSTGNTVPNMAIVPVAPCDWADCGGAPMIGIYNGSSAGTHILVDLVGVYDDGSIEGGLRFRPLTPTRITDTRSGLGTTKLGTGSTKTVTAPGSVANDQALALAMNVTAVAPTKDTYLSLWPASVEGLGRPTVSNLTPRAGQTVSNASATLLGPANGFNIYNLAGSTDVVIDVVGTFVFVPTSAASAGQGAGKVATGGTSAHGSGITVHKVLIN